jgi:hypothetical protein
MPIARQDLSHRTVLVAYDLRDDDTRETFRAFLLDTLNAIERTDSMFELEFDTSIMSLTEFKNSLKTMLGSNEDVVYLWYHYHDSESKELLFRRTAITID